MSIGLYDIDFMTYTYVPFNLQLMKLAAYYKRKKEVVVLAPVLEPERYQKMYVVKDYFDGEFDRRILAPNVNYNGHAFTKEKYIALPEEIELTKPDKYLYTKYDKVFCVNKKKQELFDTMIHSEHIRLSLDGKSIWRDCLKTFNVTNTTRAVIFHDYDLGKIKDGYDFVKEILNKLNPNFKYGQLLGTKFPIQCDNPNDLLKWLSFNPMDIFYTLRYNNIFEDEFLADIAFKYKTKVKRIQYNISSISSDENHFIEHVLPKIYRQALFLRSRHTPVTLIYTDGFFKDRRWERIIQLFNLYMAFEKSSKVLRPGFRDFSRDFTLFRYITSKNFTNNVLKDWYTIEELRDLFQLVREKNYETFKMFYESCIMELKGGQIVDFD